MYDRSSKPVHERLNDWRTQHLLREEARIKRDPDVLNCTFIPITTPKPEYLRTKSQNRDVFENVSVATHSPKVMSNITRAPISSRASVTGSVYDRLFDDRCVSIACF